MDTLEKIDVLDAKVKTAVRLIVSLREEKNALLDRLEKILGERDSLFAEKEELLKEKEQFDSIHETISTEKEKVSLLCKEFELKNKDLEIQVSSLRDSVEDLEKKSSSFVGDSSLIESGIQDAINRLDEIEQGGVSEFSPIVEPSIQKEAEAAFEESAPVESFDHDSTESEAIVVEEFGKEEAPQLGEPSVDVSIEEIGVENPQEVETPRELFDSSDDEEEVVEDDSDPNEMTGISENKIENEKREETESVASRSEEQPDRARDLFQSQDDELEEEEGKDFFSQDSDTENSVNEASGTNSFYSEKTSMDNQPAATQEASVDVPIESVDSSSSDSLEIF